MNHLHCTGLTGKSTGKCSEAPQKAGKPPLTGTSFAIIDSPDVLAEASETENDLKGFQGCFSDLQFLVRNKASLPEECNPVQPDITSAVINESRSIPFVMYLSESFPAS